MYNCFFLTLWLIFLSIFFKAHWPLLLLTLSSKFYRQISIEGQVCKEFVKIVQNPFIGEEEKLLFYDVVTTHST